MTAAAPRTRSAVQVARQVRSGSRSATATEDGWAAARRKRRVERAQLRVIAPQTDLSACASCAVGGASARRGSCCWKCGTALPGDAYVFTSSPDGNEPWRPDTTTHRFIRARRQAAPDPGARQLRRPARAVAPQPGRRGHRSQDGRQRWPPGWWIPRWWLVAEWTGAGADPVGRDQAARARDRP